MTRTTPKRRQGSNTLTSGRSHELRVVLRPSAGGPRHTRPEPGLEEGGGKGGACCLLVLVVSRPSDQGRHLDLGGSLESKHGRSGTGDRGQCVASRCHADRQRQDKRRRQDDRGESARSSTTTRPGRDPAALRQSYILRSNYLGSDTSTSKILTTYLGTYQPRYMEYHVTRARHTHTHTLSLSSLLSPPERARTQRDKAERRIESRLRPGSREEHERRPVISGCRPAGQQQHVTHPQRHTGTSVGR